jgi:hypothetical protein
MDRQAQIDRCTKALGDVMSARRYEMTDFEADVWLKLIDKIPAESFLAFLSHHFSTSPFAPQPADASKFLDTSLNPQTAYLELARMVREFGPYQEPPIQDPILVSAILLMGGWAKVNQDMPDLGDFSAKAFKERFEASFSQAVVQVRIQGAMPAQALKRIGDNPQPALLAGSQPQRIAVESSRN